jgi:ADP-ribosylglycohydrolase
LVGALAGARHGVQVIPEHWIETVRRPSGVCLKFAAQEDIPTLAQQLAGLIL